MGTLTHAIQLAREWQQAQASADEPDPSRHRLKPIQLNPDAILCHTNAAWDKESRKAGLGWVFSNNQKQIHITKSTTTNHVGSPLMAEALAALNALRHASDLGFTKVSLASDSVQLIEAIKSEIHQKELHGTLHDVRSIISSFQSFTSCSIPREKNREADALAKAVLRNSITVLV